MMSQGEAAFEPMPIPRIPDEDHLVRRCQSGDSGAFRLILEEYKNIVFGAALLMTRDYQLAEELTQDTFLRAWEGIGGFRTGLSLRPWLLRIVHNCVVSHRRKKRITTAPMILLEGIRSEEPGPDAIYDQVESHERLRRAIATLPEDYRDLVVLHYFAELTVPEIAQAMGWRHGPMGWREGTVKSRLHRALKKLGEILNEGGLSQ